MPEDPLVITGLIVILIALISGITLIIYLLSRKSRRIEEEGAEAEKAFEQQLLEEFSESRPSKAPSAEAEGPASVMDAEPDPFADTDPNILYTSGQSKAAGETPVSKSTPSSRPPDNLVAPFPPPSDAFARSADPYNRLAEIARRARTGDPVAAALWQINQSGQLECLEEKIPLGEHYSSAQALRLTNGKRVIILPPHIPEERFQLIAADCDAVVLFPDNITPLFATPLGKHLIDNIFENENKT